jgi:Uma2 family endonuclease
MTALPVHEEYQPDEPLASPVPSAWWDTFEDPPGMRAEVIQGELVLSPSPNLEHQIVVTALIGIFLAMAPPEYRVLSDLEWRFDERGFVARSPRPDVLIIPRAHTGPLVDAPLLAVEVLSPSDRRPLQGKPLLKIDGKILDYSANGLRHYLEIALSGSVPTATLAVREPDGHYSQLATAAGDELFQTEEPFPFAFRPNDLLA